MACITVKNESGENDPRFTDLVNVFRGDENKALREFVRMYYFKENPFNFLVRGDAPTDSIEFMNDFFVYDDKFTPVDAENIRSKKDQMVEKVMVGNAEHYRMFDVFGKPHVFPLNELDKNIDKYINESREAHNSVLNNVMSVIRMDGFSKPSELLAKLSTVFKSISTDVFYTFMRGLDPKNVMTYADYAGKDLHFPSLNNENIMLHEQDFQDTKIFDILIPSIETGKKSRFAMGMTSFMERVFDDTMLARKKGFTLLNNNEGKKTLIAAMVALSIKRADPNARVKSVRFGNFSFSGEVHNLDLYEGVKNLRAIYENEETRGLLTPDLLALIKETENIPEASFMASAHEMLLSSELGKKARNEIYSKELVSILEGDNHGKMVAAINRRINKIVQVYNSDDVNGKKRYEDMDDPVGKEMLLLAKAKEELMQHSGLDRRILNTDKQLGKLSAWIKSLGDFASSEMNLLFQEYKSMLFKAKQDFTNKFLKKKDPVFKKYIDSYQKEYGVSIKNMAFNYTQDMYRKLFETTEARVMQKGKLTDEKVQVNTLKFKDPEDNTNDLLDFEREFIRETIALHKESIVRFIDRKIINGEIDASLYKDGETWYEKEYSGSERNLPVMGKKSEATLVEGKFIESVKTNMVEAGNFLEIVPDDFRKERRIRKYGSATSSRGGIYGSRERLSALGLEMYNGEIVVNNENRNNQVDFDVEQVLHSSVYQNFKYEFESQINATYTAVRILLINKELEQGKDRSVEISTLKNLFNYLFYNERQEIGQYGTNVSKPFDVARTFVGTATLMFNYKSALLTLSGNMFALLSNAMATRFGSNYFNLKDLTKAVAFSMNPKNFKIFGDIVDMFLFHDRSESALVYSGKFKEGGKGLVKDHHKMWMHSMADRIGKGWLLTAQLMHEGLLENFKYDDQGNLFYDWASDKRDQKIKDHIRKRNEEQEKESLPYDDVLINTLSSISAKIYGAMSDEDKMQIQTHAIGQWAIQFKGYLIGRAQELVQSGFENQNISWYRVDDNGNLKLETYYQEGILNTFLEFGKELKRLKAYSPQGFAKALDNMKPEQRANLRKLGADVTMFSMAVLAYAAVFYDEEDEKWKKKFRASAMYTYMKFAILDIVGIYNVMDYKDAILPPTVAYLDKINDAMKEFLKADFESGLVKTAKTTGLGKSVSDVVSLFEE